MAKVTVKSDFGYEEEFEYSFDKNGDDAFWALLAAGDGIAREAMRRKPADFKDEDRDTHRPE